MTSAQVVTGKTSVNVTSNSTSEDYIYTDDQNRQFSGQRPDFRCDVLVGATGRMICRK